jgi:hypothetical protein
LDPRAQCGARVPKPRYGVVGKRCEPAPLARDWLCLLETGSWKNSATRTGMLTVVMYIMDYNEILSLRRITLI